MHSLLIICIAIEFHVVLHILSIYDNKLVLLLPYTVTIKMHPVPDEVVTFVWVCGVITHTYFLLKCHPLQLPMLRTHYDDTKEIIK